MLDKIGEAFRKGIDKIASAILIDKKLIDEIIRELQRALLLADVDVALVKQISEEIRKEGSKKVKGIEKRELLIKLLYDKLLEILGESHDLKLKKGLNKIMLIGLYGAGKTTTAVKLANYFAKRGKKTCVIGLDVHRPAASEQLEQLAEKASIACFTDKQERDASKIWKKFEHDIAKYDVCIIDTAGRDVLDKKLVNEIKKLDKLIKPDYKLFVIAADIGQAAKKQASEMQKACKINGVIITRMDSSAKGGGALTACAETKAPVFFIGTGEKLADIEAFSSQAFIQRLLGMGDLHSLIEKVRNIVDERQEQKLKQKLEEGKFTLLELKEHLASMQELGPFDKLLGMIPGFGKINVSDNVLQKEQEKVKRWQYAIDSMTIEEIENPEIMEKESSRLQRVARGSGTTIGELRQLLAQYKLLKSLIKQGKNLENLGPDMLTSMSQKELMRFAKKFRKKFRL